MRFYIGVAGLPGLEIEVNLHPSLFLTEGVGHFHDQCEVVFHLSLAVGTSKELKDLLPCFRWYMNPHPQ